jgi:2-succinyl-5-enolpyruvyl-6-hydroxy-3-cyclohexene-1-carboxylate synthase
MTLDYANANSLAASLMIEELVRNGISSFCISPGSRSTPLAAAAARHPETKTVVHYDERGASFFALGHARGSGQPAAMICTSGTAVANCLPAVVEASMDMIPLIVLTADRPPELRDTGANQTIDQSGLFGRYVRWQADLPCPDYKLDPTYWLTTIDQAVYRSQNMPAGPVHLNCMFREPLAPLPADNCRAAQSESIENWKAGSKPYTNYATPGITLNTETLEECAGIINDAPCGLLLVGSLRSEKERQAVRRLSKHLGWPTMPDIRSGLRFDDDNQIIHYYDLLLQADKLNVDSQRPIILQIGSRMVSKRLVQFIEKTHVHEYMLVDNHPFRHDPGHRLGRRLESDISIFCDSMTPLLHGHNDKTELDQVTTANCALDALLDKTFRTSGELSEAAVARLISKQITSDCALFLASSMSIRLMDMYAAPGSRVMTAANRGASGIDGTVASAAGFADGSGRRTVLLSGDLALLHDLNSLSLLNKNSQPVTIVVLNNNGGAIFDFLPVSKCDDIFEEFFITPHGMTFEKAAAMFELKYSIVDSVESFGRIFKQALTDDRSWLIEVPISRSESQKTHSAILAHVKQATL